MKFHLMTSEHILSAHNMRQAAATTSTSATGSAGTRPTWVKRMQQVIHLKTCNSCTTTGWGVAVKGSPRSVMLERAWRASSDCARWIFLTRRAGPDCPSSAQLRALRIDVTKNSANDCQLKMAPFSTILFCSALFENFSDNEELWVQASMSGNAQDQGTSMSQETERPVAKRLGARTWRPPGRDHERKISDDFFLGSESSVNHCQFDYNPTLNWKSESWFR